MMERYLVSVPLTRLLDQICATKMISIYHNLNTPTAHPNILYFPINLIC